MRGSASNVVIVVEDDHSLGNSLERILRLGGLVPLPYPSAEALMADGLADSACLVIDVQLPGISGFALHDRLASKGPLPPVVFISAYDEPDAREAAARVGALFLAKPFSGRLLLETNRELKGGQRPRQPPLANEPC